MSSEEISNLLKHSKDLLNSFNLDHLKNEFTELKNQTLDVDFWNDSNKAKMVTKDLSVLEKKISRIDDLNESIQNLEVALELEDEAETARYFEKLSQLKDLFEKQKYLSGKFDSNGAVLSIHSGAGGVDAQDWAAMLTSMYETFAKHKNWEYSLVSLSLGAEGGIKNAVLDIQGEFAYGLLKEEAGVHRLVRVSPFNSGGTRETSFAMVEVVPTGLDKEIDIEIHEIDLKWDYYMSSGKGGQSVNTTYSAVRVTHIPTGIVITCQNQRSQHQNKLEALKYLKNKLSILEIKKQKDMHDHLKGEHESPEWGAQVRNYVLHPYKLIKDSRSGWETKNPDDLLEKGNLEDVIWSVKLANAEAVE